MSKTGVSPSKSTLGRTGSSPAPVMGGGKRSGAKEEDEKEATLRSEEWWVGTGELKQNPWRSWDLEGKGEGF